MKERNDFVENLLFIASMLVVGILISFLKFKFQISDKIWNVLRVNKIYIKVIISLIFVVILSTLISFIIEKLSVSQLVEQIINGAIVGLAFLFIPSSLEQNKKRG